MHPSSERLDKTAAAKALQKAAQHTLIELATLEARLHPRIERAQLTAQIEPLRELVAASVDGLL